MAQFATPDIHFDLTQTKAELASIACDSRGIDEQIELDDQRMFFLLNADTARKDFYEIRSSKNGEVRRIVINADAEIIFDSENTVVVPEGNAQLPEFDEINEQFSQVIPDNCSGRQYYRKLRGVSITKIPQDLPRAVRQEMKRAQQETANENARELRKIIVENFRSQDCLERQGEIDEILCRKNKHEQEQVELQARQESLQQALLHLQKQVAELELKDKLEEEAEQNAKRVREHDSKRLAWLNRLDPPASVQQVPGGTDKNGTNK